MIYTLTSLENSHWRVVGVSFVEELITESVQEVSRILAASGIGILLAAVIISEVLFGRLFVNFGLKLFAVSIGAIVYYIVLQLVLQLGLNTNDLKLFTAIIVAIFLAVPHLQAQAKSSFSHAKKLSEKERSEKSC